MPADGWAAVTVPGAVSTWSEVSQRFGRIPFSECLQPAIAFAREGFSVTPVIAKIWEKEYRKFQSSLPPTLFQQWKKRSLIRSVINHRVPVSAGSSWNKPIHWRKSPGRMANPSTGVTLAEQIGRCAREGGGISQRHGPGGIQG